MSEYVLKFDDAFNNATDWSRSKMRSMIRNIVANCGGGDAFYIHETLGTAFLKDLTEDGAAALCSLPGAQSVTPCPYRKDRVDLMYDDDIHDDHIQAVKDIFDRHSRFCTIERDENDIYLLHVEGEMDSDLTFELSTTHHVEWLSFVAVG